MPRHGDHGALAGLRVIDLSRVLGGPYCTQILGDHGADVIKVEPPQGDETRRWGPPFQHGTASYYLAVNRNKRGITLDLARRRGREVLLALLEDADVLVENFKPGTMEKWGLDYSDVLEKRFPRLVYCRVSGFGADGPLGGLPGYDAAVQATAGLMSINGDRAGDPTRIGVPIVDLATGLNATVGILLALQDRERSGRGQFVDVAMFDCGLSVLHPHLSNYLYSGEIPARTGNAHPNITPYEMFRTGTTPIFLAVGSDAQFRKLCENLGRPTLADDRRYSTNAERSRNKHFLKEELERLLAHRDAGELASDLIRSGVPCGSVLTIDAVAAHPHTKHREMLVQIGDYLGTGSPIKLSRTPAAYRLPPPTFGEHNRQLIATTPAQDIREDPDDL